MIPTFPSLIGLTYPVGRAPVWRTIKQAAISGKDTRVQLWTAPRYKYEISLSYLGSGAAGQNQDWQTLMGFWNGVAGDALPFHWTDPYDNTVANQPLGTGDGATTIFNFVRTLGGFVEPVQDVAAVTSVKVGGTATTAYTLLTDPNWGFTYALQFATAPASGAALTWSGSYNWPCRFETGDRDNTLDLANLMFQFWELRKVGFATMKVV
jgi:uncharacterized protein (TIGR02217 family)